MNQKNNHQKHNEVGHLSSYYGGVGRIKGLPTVMLNELLLDQGGYPVGMVIGFDKDTVETMFFKTIKDTKAPFYRSFKTFKVVINDSILGRVVNGINQPIDGGPKLKGDEYDIYNDAPKMTDRDLIDTALQTGIKVIDIALSIGRGQRELIIGDRKLGKTTLAVDTIINQRYAKPKVKCIYIAIGQTTQNIKRVINILRKNRALEYTTIVAASAENELSHQYLAPYLGCRIAEYFRDKGEDVLVVYDDLSKHAKVYRNMSLLLERTPGRETYPGDIFSIHARLLERAAKLNKNKGGGSLTALPIVETQEGDITSFIATNLISITDGQIYLDRNLFQKNMLPSINLGYSVSRIGSRVQTQLLQQVAGGIRIILAQYKELQKLYQFETQISEEAQKKYTRSSLLTEILKQPEHTFVSNVEQFLLIFLLNNGYLDDIDQNTWQKSELLLIDLLKTKYRDLLKVLEKNKLGEQTKNRIEEAIKNFKTEFVL